MRGTPAGKQVVVVGLGNPGPAYASHRHNIGFVLVDTLAREAQASWRAGREKLETCTIELEGSRVVLLKPLTFMNLSGHAVLPVLKRSNADPARMIVAHDDMDLAAGTVRIKVGGGDGGHKGVRSIADSLRFRDFIRVRLGVGRPPHGMPPEDFVLSDFRPEEAEIRKNLISAGMIAVRLVIRDGVGAAQNALHSGRLPAVAGARGL